MEISKISGSRYQNSYTFGKKNEAETGHFNTLNSVEKLDKHIELINTEIYDTIRLKKARETKVQTEKSVNNLAAAEILKDNSENTDFDEIIDELNLQKKIFEKEKNELLKKNGK